MEKIRKHIIELVKRSKSILIMPSAPVDGDSLGGALSLYLTLKKIGKQATVVCADPVPEAFQFLPTTKIVSHEFTAANDFIVALDCKKAKIKNIRTMLEHDKVNIIITAKKGQFSKEDVSFHSGPSRYDLIITVDTADLEQLGRFYEDNTELFSTVPLINIDHHASNGYFGKINLVDIMASASTELLIPLIRDFENDSGKEIMDEDIATLILAGIITDTGSFQNANTTPRSFAAASQMIKQGARQQEIIQHVFKTKSLSTLRLWGRILTNLRTDPKHKFVWSTISRRDFAETGSREDETGGIIDELLTNAPGTEVVLLLKERVDGIVSGSVRTTTPSVDASQIAEMFGGGGHTQAAGFKIQSTDFTGIEKMITEKIREFQERHLPMTEEEEPLAENKAAAKKQSIPQAELPVEKMTEVSRREDETHHEEEVVKAHAEPKKKDKKIQSGENRYAAASEDDEETFTEKVIRKTGKDEEQEVELDPGVTYKFEE
jgi:bifunctional oligoribonuclease and PAP phosphatase NrnA